MACCRGAELGRQLAVPLPLRNPGPTSLLTFPAHSALSLRRAAQPTSSSGKGFTEEDYAVLQRMLGWPTAQLFPALDLACLVVLDAAAAARLATSAAEVAEGAPSGSLGRALAAAAGSVPPLPANQQTALRLACNTFAFPGLLAWVQAQRVALLAAFAPCAASPNKKVRQGLATLLVNLGVVLSRMVGDELELKASMLRLASELLAASPAEDVETRFRCVGRRGAAALRGSAGRAPASRWRRGTEGGVVGAPPPSLPSTHPCTMACCLPAPQGAGGSGHAAAAAQQGAGCRPGPEHAGHGAGAERRGGQGRRGGCRGAEAAEAVGRCACCKICKRRSGSRACALQRHGNRKRWQ